jgi:hypothetical protein
MIFVRFFNGPASLDRFIQKKIFFKYEKQSRLAKLDHSNIGPFNNQTQIGHLKTGFVRYLVVHCTFDDLLKKRRKNEFVDRF